MRNKYRKNILTLVTATLILASSLGASTEASAPAVNNKINTSEITEFDYVLPIALNPFEDLLADELEFTNKITYLEVQEDGFTSFSHGKKDINTLTAISKGDILISKTELSDGYYELMDGTYVSMSQVAVRDDLGNKLFVRVNVETLNVRPTPGIDDSPLRILYKGEFVEAISVTENGWYTINDGEFINGKYADILNVSPEEFAQLKIDREAAIQAAKELAAKKAAEKKAREEAAAKDRQRVSQAIQQQQQTQQQQSYSGSGSYANITLSASERDYLARLVYCEANGQPFEGQVAVAQVVLNRMLDSRFPSTLHGVINARGQFVPVSTGKINRVNPTQTQYDAIDAAFKSGNLNGAVYFYNPSVVKGAWWDSLTMVKVIGSHAFKK